MQRDGGLDRADGAGLAGLLLALAVTLGLPSWAMSQAMNDGELDHVTASGQPTIVSAGDNSTVDFAEATDIALHIASNSQAGLRALVLNNVAGENQIANGINISGANTTEDQVNAIEQSWGSINETTAIVVPGGTASVEVVCSGLICKVDASAIAGQGVVQVLGATGDQIVTAGAASTLSYRAATMIAMTIDSNSQTNLVGLVVNNIAGLNQVGNAINIKGGGVNLTDSGLAVTAASGQGGGQSNVINQYRGTPANFTR